MKQPDLLRGMTLKQINDMCVLYAIDATFADGRLVSLDKR